MTEVLVIGAGAAGLVAALAAAHAGAAVTLLEAGDGSASNLAISGGMAAAAGTGRQAEAGIEDDASIWLADIVRATGGSADPTVSVLVTANAARALAFVADACATPVTLIDDIVFPGHSVPRLHQIGGLYGAGLSTELLAAARRERRIGLHEATRVDDFLFEDGRVAGAVAGAALFRASSTILCAGGFGAGARLLARYLPDMLGAQYIGNAASDGLLIEKLMARGAPVRDMGGFQGHGHATVKAIGRLGAGVTTVGALLVNREGRRFANEDVGPSGLAAHVGAQDGSRAIEIYTEAMHDSFLRFASYRDAVDRGEVMRFATLGELAAHFGIDASRLAETLDDFNRAAAGEIADALGRTDFRGPVEAPFRAVEVTAALVHTQGGLLVDERTRVIGGDGHPLPGLFAAGGAAVGMTGNHPSGYLPGHGLAQSLTLGLLAGENAVRGD